MANNKIKYIHSLASKKELDKYIDFAGSVTKAAKMINITTSLIYLWKRDHTLISVDTAFKIEDVTNLLCRKEVLLQVTRKRSSTKCNDMYEYIYINHIESRLALTGLTLEYYIDHCLGDEVKQMLIADPETLDDEAFKTFSMLFGGEERYWREIRDIYIKQ